MIGSQIINTNIMRKVTIVCFVLGQMLHPLVGNVGCTKSIEDVEEKFTQFIKQTSGEIVTCVLCSPSMYLFQFLRYCHWCLMEVALGTKIFYLSQHTAVDGLTCN